MSTKQTEDKVLTHVEKDRRLKDARKAKDRKDQREKRHKDEESSIKQKYRVLKF